MLYVRGVKHTARGPEEACLSTVGNLFSRALTTLQAS